MSREFNGFNDHEFTKWMEDFILEAGFDFFRSGKKGEIIAITRDNFVKSNEGEKYLGQNYFVSKDGQNFFQVQQNGFSGSNEEYNLTYVDPHGEVKKKYRLSLKDKVLTRTDSNGSTQSFLPAKFIFPDNHLFHVLPEVRKPEYLFKTKSGKYFYADNVEYNYAYEKMRLFVGKPDSMKQIPIDDIERFRDGGTTYITTPIGILFSPTPFNKDGKPTWTKKGESQKAIELQRFDPGENLELIKNFVLIEK